MLNYWYRRSERGQSCSCGIKRIDLPEDSITNLGVFYSCNENQRIDKIFTRPITNIEKVLRLWRMQNLTLDGKITIS